MPSSPARPSPPPDREQEPTRQQISRRLHLVTASVASPTSSPSSDGYQTPPPAPWGPRSVANTLELTLEEYFACGSVMDLLASQSEEPDRKWVCSCSYQMGREMAAEVRRRRMSRTK